MAKPTMHLEVHEHTFISGVRASGGCYSPTGEWMTSTFSHSHPGGGIPHEHPNTGPACYTIDKDEWRKATGLRGGGRKKFTKKATGPQLQWVAREPGADTFEVILCKPTPPEWGTGPGASLPARLMLANKMNFTVRVDHE